MPPQPGSVIAGKYRLEEPLAEGGMGAVWVARHIELDVDVAIKFVSEHLDKSERARMRFRREARAAARLKGPNITQIHDFGVENDVPYLVMELLEGEDLDTLLEREHHLTLERTADIVEQLSRGLKLAHDANIVHRDLKPANVFLAQSGDQEIVKILDFGVAKEMTLVDDDGTASGVVVGSPRFMSPEQTIGEALDHRSDLWSLAVLMYMMVTGECPVEGGTLGKVFNQICVASFLPPSALCDKIPPRVDAFFDVALSKSREHRYDSATEMAQTFRAVVNDEPLPSRRSAKPSSRLSSSRNAGAGQGRDDATTDAPMASLSVERDAADDKPVAVRSSDDGTSPGFGLDAAAQSARHRPLLWALGAVVVVAIVGLVVLRGGSGDTVSSSIEPTAAVSNPSPLVLTPSVAPSVGPSAERATAIPLPSATQVASVAPPQSPAPPALPPPLPPRSSVVAAPPSRPKPPAASPSPGTKEPDPLFGIPVKKP